MGRLAMRGIKSLGVGLECREAGIGAKENCPSAVFSMRKIAGIGIVKDPSTKSHKMSGANLDELGFIHCLYFTSLK